MVVVETAAMTMQDSSLVCGVSDGSRGNHHGFKGELYGLRR